MDAETANLLLEGLRRSPTLRMLAERVEQSDVFVVCTLVPSLRGRRGALIWMAANSDTRYVRAAVVSALPPDTIIATFGHELQHAVELVAAPWVKNLHLFEALYRQIGLRESSGSGSYDTEAAREAGHAVARELKEHASSPPSVFVAPLRASDWIEQYYGLRESDTAVR